MEILEKIFQQLDKAIEKENDERRQEGALGLPHAEIKILGQMSLISNPEVQAKITLFATFDVDAIIKAPHWIETAFKNLLEKERFELDPLSHEIWIPKESTFTTIFSSSRLTCSRLDPLFTLLSKAIKAKEKNKVLIAQALAVYGDDLKNLIIKYEGDLNYFKLKK